MLLLPSLLPWLFVCPFPQVPISSTMLQKEAEWTRDPVWSCIFFARYTLFSRMFARVLPLHIYAAQWTAYLLDRGRFIECGRQRSDSHVFTSRQFFHLAPLPSRTRTSTFRDRWPSGSYFCSSLFSASFSLMLFLSDQSVSSTDIHSSCTRHEIRRDVLSRRLQSDCHHKFYE